MLVMFGLLQKIKLELYTIRFIMARNCSCGKVMFSQACVIPSVHTGGSA